MREIAYYNGKITPLSEALIPADDRAFYFGDGIYDVASVRKRKCFALDDHVNRFFDNADHLKMNLGLSKEELKKICRELIALQDPDVEEAILYFQASRGTAPRNHAFPKDAKTNLYFTLKPKAFGKMGKEVSAILEDDIRFLMCNIKTLNLLPNVMAQQKAVEENCYEAILHRGGRVTEGSHSGVSIIRNGVLQTPPLDNLILPSITRKHILEICSKMGIPTLEKPFTVEELLNADEIIIMSTTALVNRCTVIDGKKVGGKDPETLEKIIFGYKEKILSETE